MSALRSIILPLPLVLACHVDPEEGAAGDPAADLPADDPVEGCEAPLTWYPDVDADGYPGTSGPVEACEQPGGYLPAPAVFDCDDADAAIFPGAPELCNEIDDDCDMDVDEELGHTWYADADCDGYGDALATAVFCEPPPGWVAVADDCDDLDPEVNPGVAGTCDPAEGAYLADRVMVGLAEGMDLAALADELGVDLLALPGASGLGAVAVPEGLDAGEFVDLLLTRPEVIEAAREGLVQVASDRASPLQWHLDAIAAPAPGAADLAEYVVAVLDTGVAYEDHLDLDGTLYVPAPSLAASTFVDPWDFVDGDAHANDEHQHGTHIASTIASWGEVEGVAPGVSIMPVRVLDEHGSGTELALVEGIHYAIDNDADVINLSVAFQPDYQPSRALHEALQEAWDAGIVVVGAAGNHGAGVVSYPAAHPLVIAAGATALGEQGSQKPAPYGNTGIALDLLAPGGALDRDIDENSVPDGIVAEAITPGAPERVGLWAMAGTSQAAALVSGAVVHLLAQGVAPHSMAQALHFGAQGVSEDRFEQGLGFGNLDVQATLDHLDEFDHDPQVTYEASLLPWLVVDPAEPTLVYPAAQVRVVGSPGAKVRTRKVYVEFNGSTTAVVKCKIETDAGDCSVLGPPADASDAASLAEAQVGWVITVGGVGSGSWVTRPSGFIHLTDAFEILTAAMEAEPDLDDALLAFRVAEGQDVDLPDLYKAKEVSDPDALLSAPAVVALDAMAGLFALPRGLAVTPGALDAAATLEDLALDLDAAGLSSSPVGAFTVSFGRLDAAGLSSSPIGARSPSVVVVPAATVNPLGLDAADVFSARNGAYDSDLLGFAGETYSLASGATEADLSGSALQARLDAGGWATEEGYAIGSALCGVEVVDVYTAPAEPVTDSLGVAEVQCLGE